MSAYEYAKSAYAKYGVDTEAAIETLKNVTVAMHCWQGDDVTGFDNKEALSGGIQTTGNYPGKARCPEELMGFEGYQAYANSDGLVPVTEELRDFLLGYCFNNQYFYDGLGSLEKAPVNGKYYQAVGDSGWLFACAYYEKN